MPTFDDFKKAVTSGSPNPTPQPIKLKSGQMLTPDMFNQSAKNGMPFTSLQTMADWYNDWSKKVPANFNASPYYRVYGNSQPIHGGDMAILFAKYKDDPKVLQVLNRNIAKPGEVPMYSPQDGDTIKSLMSQK